MKKHLLPALALAAALLCACGPKGDGSGQSSAPDILTRPPATGDLLPPPADSSSQSVQEVPKPDLEVLAQWRGDYRYDAQYLNQSLAQLAGSYDLTSCFRWPDGRELVRVDAASLLFSGPAGTPNSVCAAVALDLRQPATLEELRTQWGESLTFRADDPVASPSWTVTDGSMTYHFRTDPTGQTLLEEGLGGNLVLSMDALLPDAPGSGWISSGVAWEELWVEAPGGPWTSLLTYAQALGSAALPTGATAQANQADLDLFFAQRGVKDPGTGVQYFSYEADSGSPWDGVLVPASLILGSALPTGMDEVMAALDVPFTWNSYGSVGYWFYVGQYKFFLSSNLQGGLNGDSYFLVCWGDNADV